VPISARFSSPAPLLDATSCSSSVRPVVFFWFLLSVARTGSCLPCHRFCFGVFTFEHSPEPRPSPRLSPLVERRIYPHVHPVCRAQLGAFSRILVFSLCLGPFEVFRKTRFISRTPVERVPFRF